MDVLYDKAEGRIESADAIALGQIPYRGYPENNLPFWSIGRSLQSKPPSFHPDLLEKGGGHRPPPFPPRTALPVHGASRTLVFFRLLPPLDHFLRLRKL